MGDYEIKDNSLVSAAGVPTFKESDRSVKIRHREYLQDVTGSTGFSLQSLALNPGNSTTFPWLSTIARSFAQYRFHGLMFEFVSASADSLNSVNTALGYVVMATQYNAALPAFLNKQEMEEYDFSCSTRPSRTLIHPVECSPADTPLEHLYIRGGSLPAGSDIRLYDLGTFQLATVGMQAAANIGELWVTYDVELIKPRIQPGGVAPGSFTRVANGPYVANANVLGVLQTAPYGTLGVTIGSITTGWDAILFPPSITAGRFLVTLTWWGSVATNITAPSFTFSNLIGQSVWNLASQPNSAAPFGGTANSTTFTMQFIVTVNGYNVAGSFIKIGSGGTLPLTPTGLDIVVVPFSLSDNYV